ncbi:MAG: methyltransferase [Campylobacteraceae bacterium]|jgi:tRNA1(Val) A37 N6-methylase TrmN6|nr:methyltransferase [Campylobacteraceae bacterium]
MKIYQYESGYRYTSDVMFLYDFISRFNPKGSVLDVGCGSGILGFLIKRDFPNIKLTSLDIQKEHIDLALRNAKENDIKTDIILNDFRTYKSDVKFDNIISNPPFYIHNTKQSEDEKLKISRYANNLPLKTFFAQSYKMLRPKGNLFFCYDSKQIEDIMYEIHNYKLKICDVSFVYSKKNSESKLSLFRARKDSNSLATIHPPIFVYKNEKYSKDTKRIFKKANTESFTCQL